MELSGTELTEFDDVFWYNSWSWTADILQLHMPCYV